MSKRTYIAKFKKVITHTAEIKFKAKNQAEAEERADDIVNNSWEIDGYWADDDDCADIEIVGVDPVKRPAKKGRR